MKPLCPEIAVISHRKLDRQISWEPIFEIEDLLVHYCAALIADAKELRSWPSLAAAIQARFGLQHEVQNLADSARILLVIARHPGDLNVVNSINRVRQRFSRIFGYVVDSYFYEGFGPAVHKYDHLFVTGSEDVRFVTEVLGVSASLLRQGIDTLRWHSDRSDRCIDVISFGRTPASYHRALQARFHDPASAFMYLHSPLGSISGPEVAAERPMFFQLLRRSKLCLAFHMFVEPVGARPRSMMVTNRWLEALTSGCLIVGRRPIGEMADDMLGWPEATCELAEDPPQAMEQIVHLLSSSSELSRHRRVNLLQVRKRHDLRWRLKDMLQVMGAQIPLSLQDDINTL